MSSISRLGFGDGGVGVSGNRMVDVYVVKEGGGCRLLGIREVGFLAPGDFGKILDYSSSMTVAAVSFLAKKYLFPEGARFVIPGPRDRACSAPFGYFTFLEDFLKVGLRFPFHHVFNELLVQIGVPLGQLMPNSFRHLVVLGVEGHRNKMPLSVDLIVRYIISKRLNGSLYLSPRTGQGVKAKCPGKLNNWQRKFFFYRLNGVLDAAWCTGAAPDIAAGTEANPKNLLSELKALDPEHPGLSSRRPS